MTIATAITWSSYSTAQACRRAYWYRYCEGIESTNQSKSDALVIGDAVHRLCGGERVVPDLPEELGPIVNAMVAAWLVRWGELRVTPDRQIEAWVHETLVTDDPDGGQVEVTIGAHCDEIRTVPKPKNMSEWETFHDDTIVVERKTTTHVDRNYLDRLHLDQQIALQAFLAGTPRVVYDVIQRAPIKRQLGETDAGFLERRQEAARKNKSGKSDIKRKVEESIYSYRQRLVNWYNQNPDALLRCDLTIPYERQHRVVTQVANMARRLRLDQLDVIAGKHTIDDEFPQSTQRCFDWGRRCEYWDACTSADSDAVKAQLYTIRTKREGDPPTNGET